MIGPFVIGPFWAHSRYFPAHASTEALRTYQSLISDDVALLDCFGLNFIPIFSNRPEKFRGLSL